MRDIKDYLHLYLGCDVQTKWHLVCTLVAITKSDYNPYSDCKIMRKDQSKVMLDTAFSNIKPILRKLSSMTEEEAIEIGEIVIGSYDSVKFKADKKLSNSGTFNYWKVHKEHRGYGKSLTIDENGEVDVYDSHNDGTHTIYMKQHFVTKHLLSKHFDLFQLIESGLAIDKNTLKD